MTVLAISLVVLSAIALVGYFLYARNREKALWNDGVSPNSGLQWQLIDRESVSGARRYKAGSEEIVIAYGVDKFVDDNDRYPL